MKINLLKIVVIIICFLSFKINAELVFEDNFPKNLQGIWSEDCKSEYQVFIIYYCLILLLKKLEKDFSMYVLFFHYSH